MYEHALRRSGALRQDEHRLGSLLQQPLDLGDGVGLGGNHGGACDAGMLFDHARRNARAHARGELHQERMHTQLRRLRTGCPEGREARQRGRQHVNAAHADHDRLSRSHPEGALLVLGASDLEERIDSEVAYALRQDTDQIELRIDVADAVLVPAALLYVASSAPTRRWLRSPSASHCYC